MPASLQAMAGIYLNAKDSKLVPFLRRGMRVNIHLWKRNADTFLIKRLFDVLVHIEKYIPIMGALGPRTYRKVYRTIRQFTDENIYRLLFQYLWAAIRHLLDDAARFVNVIGITNAESHIHPNLSLTGDVGNHTAGNHPIWNDDLFVVWRQ